MERVLIVVLVLLLLLNKVITILCRVYLFTNTLIHFVIFVCSTLHNFRLL